MAQSTADPAQVAEGQPRRRRADARLPPADWGRITLAKSRPRSTGHGPTPETPTVSNAASRPLCLISSSLGSVASAEPFTRRSPCRRRDHGQAARCGNRRLDHIRQRGLVELHDDPRAGDPLATQQRARSPPPRARPSGALAARGRSARAQRVRLLQRRGERPRAGNLDLQQATVAIRHLF
jgi:hypothetical protein